MKQRKYVYLSVGLLVAVGAACAAYFETRPAAKKSGSSLVASATAANARHTGPVDETDKLPTSFLGSLTPGGSADSAGRERTYVVSYQVAFLRKSPDAKVPEESLTYRQITSYPEDKLAPYVFYGENVSGKSDPSHPESIAVQATIDGKPATGYIDAAKLWLEPALSPPQSERYMAAKDSASIYVVPDRTSPPVLSFFQGEVVEAVGRLNFRGQDWVKARIRNPETRDRYGFIPGSEVTALKFASVNQSVIGFEEVPKRMRSSSLVFSDAERKRLSQNGFYIEPAPQLKELIVDDMADAYREEKSEQFFVTSDLFLHSYHLIFDRMLQDIEEQKILPAVKKMSAALAVAAESQQRDAPPVQELRDAALDNLIYFSVAAKLFDPGFAVPAPVRAPTEALVNAIRSASGDLPTLEHPLGLDKEDFTQFKVRGHYEKTEVLQQYFRGMVWFGRRSFLLSEKTQTLAAILLPSIVEDAHQARRFEAIDAVTTYLVGRQDRYTLAGYRSINRKVFGTETPSFRQLSSQLEENVASFQRAAWADLPAPRIVSVQTGTGATQEERLRKSAGLKFLGQRYVLDAFLLNQLTSPSVGSDTNPRNLPSALDVMMLLGSRAATDMQQQVQARQQWANYDQQIEKLKKVTEEELAKPATFYDHWLYALRTLFQSTPSKQMFAVKQPWQYKSLNTGLASWTELKHDTILYAEQTAAEMGEGGEFEIPPYIPPGPKGYVEPNPALFRQLTVSIDQMLAQLERVAFVTEEYVDKFTLFRKLAKQAETIAQKEVSGEVIARQDYDWISNIHYSFDRSLLLPRDTGIIQDPSNLQMALVADVATDDVGGRVLEEGIGAPKRIIVVVKDAWGGTRLTVGFVYSWLEFPSSRRWSDSEWKKPIYSGDDKAREEQGTASPSWYSIFAKSAAGAYR
jgi:hypothetical protein